MKKFALISFCFILIIGLSGCGKNKDQEQSKNKQQETSQEETFTSSLNELLKKGKSIKCTYGYNEDGQNLKGTTYINKNKFRSDFDMKQIDGKTVKGYAINDSEYIYTWTDEDDNGTKMKISEMEKMQKNINSNTEGDKNSEYEDYSTYDEVMDYKCVNWKVNNDKFIPPKNINFMDMTEQMKKLQETMNNFGNDGDLCGICEQLPAGEDKDECRKSLGCE